MARTVAQIDAEIEALRQRKALGVSQDQYADHQVTFRSVREIDQTIAALEAEKSGLAGTARPKTFLGWASKGL